MKIALLFIAVLILAGCQHSHNAMVAQDTEAELVTVDKDGKTVQSKGIIPKGSLVDFPPKPKPVPPCKDGKCQPTDKP